MSEEEARDLYTAAAEAGQAQEQPPAPEDRLTAAMQEQEQKLRVRDSILPLDLWLFGLLAQQPCTQIWPHFLVCYLRYHLHGCMDDMF